MNIKGLRSMIFFVFLFFPVGVLAFTVIEGEVNVWIDVTTSPHPFNPTVAPKSKLGDYLSRRYRGRYLSIAKVPVAPGRRYTIYFKCPADGVTRSIVLCGSDPESAKAKGYWAHLPVLAPQQAKRRGCTEEVKKINIHISPESGPWLYFIYHASEPRLSAEFMLKWPPDPEEVSGGPSPCVSWSSIRWPLVLVAAEGEKPPASVHLSLSGLERTYQKRSHYSLKIPSEWEEADTPVVKEADITLINKNLGVILDVQTIEAPKYRPQEFYDLTISWFKKDQDFSLLSHERKMVPHLQRLVLFFTIKAKDGSHIRAVAYVPRHSGPPVGYYYVIRTMAIPDRLSQAERALEEVIQGLSLNTYSVHPSSNVKRMGLAKGNVGGRKGLVSRSEGLLRIKGYLYIHPRLRFHIWIPHGWDIREGKEDEFDLQINSRRGEGLIQVASAPSKGPTDPELYALIWEKEKVGNGKPYHRKVGGEKLEINGLRAYKGVYDSPEGIRGQIVFIDGPGRLYILTFLCEKSDFLKLAPIFDKVLKGFRTSEVKDQPLKNSSADQRSSFDWVKYIESGRSFKVIFDKTSDKFDDSRYTGDWKTDPMGTLKGGETYLLTYKDGKFTCTGYNQGTKTRGTWISSNADPQDNQLSLWGRIYRFDAQGRVYDAEYGLVGHMEPEEVTSLEDEVEIWQITVEKTEIPNLLSSTSTF